MQSYDKGSSFFIDQIENPYLAHFAYLITNGDQAIAVDPPRNPEKIYALAKQRGAKIVGVIETHAHADFVSSHLEIHQNTGATLYAHELLGAKYPHIALKDQDLLQLNQLQLQILHTPGHSPDSISIVLKNLDQKPLAVFTGDTLFIGDCGRPDLRENVGQVQEGREKLARQMYYSLREKLMTLPDEVVVYPAHGAGSLCGKALKKALSSTISAEKKDNWALQEMTEDDFVCQLITDQPFVPGYFLSDVELNTLGAPAFKPSVVAVQKYLRIDHPKDVEQLNPNILIIDTRTTDHYQNGFLPNSINLMLGGKFETWLGALVAPKEKFYLLFETLEEMQNIIERIADIGYENQIEAVGTISYGQGSAEYLDVDQFRNNLSNYTIIDVRNHQEVKDRKIFSSSISIPLGELRSRLKEIPTDKPIVIHCARGYRSAAALGIVREHLPQNKVYDLGIHIMSF